MGNITEFEDTSCPRQSDGVLEKFNPILVQFTRHNPPLAFHESSKMHSFISWSRTCIKDLQKRYMSQQSKWETGYAQLKNPVNKELKIPTSQYFSQYLLSWLARNVPFKFKKMVHISRHPILSNCTSQIVKFLNTMLAPQLPTASKPNLNKLTSQKFFWGGVFQKDAISLDPLPKKSRLPATGQQRSEGKFALVYHNISTEWGAEIAS